ncbi:M28 family peptidase [bacterium]|nr:M28 family peptidase [bacterium]
MIVKKIIVFLLLLLPMLVVAQTSTVNVDSIYSHIVHLSETIGPRPMGSRAERQALKWSADRLAQYGADTSYVMCFDRIADAGSSINTQSGVAIGIFRGVTDSTIVIGGHIDSDSREVPGANDNASGPATVLELARVWQKRPRHYTMVFCAFGGEERGLLGSWHFVRNYQQIDDVALMISIDMTGADDDIFIIMETDSSMAPAWLLRDSFELDKHLGMNRLRYPTHFSTLNNLGDGAGSDHIPFLKHHIPAIDFTVGINNFPIHTPQDRAEYVYKPMLEHCAKLVDGLLLKYQKNGIPASKNSPYILWMVLGVLVFIPLWVPGVLFILSLLIGGIAFWMSRRYRFVIEKKDRVRFSGWKLFSMAIILVFAVRAGDWLMQLVTSMRYPWLVHLTPYLWFAVFCLALGIWLALQITRRWRFSPDAYVYVKRSLVLLFIFTLLFVLAGTRLAAYPALALICMALAVLIHPSWIKFLLVALSPLPMFRLLFAEALPFTVRMMSHLGFDFNSGSTGFFTEAGLFLLLLVWTIPFIYGFAYCVVAVKDVKLGLKVIRKPLWGMGILILTVGYGALLYSLPTRNDLWRSDVHINARYDVNTQKGSLLIEGNDKLDGVTVKFDDLERSYAGKIFVDTLSHDFEAAWFEVTGEQVMQSSLNDTLDVQCNWCIQSDRSWHRVVMSLKTDTLGIVSVDTDLQYNLNDGRVNITWEVEPPEMLNIDLRLSIPGGSRLIRTVSAVYAELPLELEVKSESASVRFRTTVVSRDTLMLQ